MKTRESVIELVTNFIQGGDQSDLELLGYALHEHFINVQNGFFDKKGIFVIDREQYLSLIDDQTFGGIPREMELISVDIVGNIAMVKARLRSEKLSFTSFISLVLQETGDWKVIGNFPHVTVNDQ